MGLLGDFSPNRTREKRDEPRGSNTKLPPVRSSPVQEIKREVDDQQELIEQYAYKPDQQETIENNQDYLRAIAQKEQRSDCTVFGFYELLSMCEEYLLIFMHGAQDIKLKKINDLRKEYMYGKLEIMADYKKEVGFGSFKDDLFYYKGEVLISEDFLKLSGFLREHFQIEKVIVLYDTGEMLLQDTGYCNFWFKDRLEKYFSGKQKELNHNEMLKEDDCLRCIYNCNCLFSKKNNSAL